MPRPELSPLAITPQQLGWDASVDTNFSELKEKLTVKPIPLPLAYKTTPYTGATNISTLSASNYEYCYMHLTDAASIATNGRLIYSDGTDWRYVKSDATI